MNLYLIRHAPAGERHEWPEADVERPLSKKGLRLAEAIADALELEAITRLLSSPAVRCLQTVEPLAARLGLAIEVSSEFAEGAPVRDARALVDLLVADGANAVICAHGDLIPAVLEDLEREGAMLHGAGCAKGAVWQLIAERGRVVQAVYHGRPDDGRLPSGAP